MGNSLIFLNYANKTIDIYFAVFPKELNNIIYKDHNGNTLVSIRFWLQASVSDISDNQSIKTIFQTENKHFVNVIHQFNNFFFNLPQLNCGIFDRENTV